MHGALRITIFSVSILGLIFLWFGRDDPFQRYVDQGIAAYEKGNHAKALEALKEVVRLKRDSPEVHHNMGLVDALGQYQEAVEAYLKAIRLKPGLADAYFVLGFCLL